MLSTTWRGNQSNNDHNYLLWIHHLKNLKLKVIFNNSILPFYNITLFYCGHAKRFGNHPHAPYKSKLLEYTSRGHWSKSVGRQYDCVPWERRGWGSVSTSWAEFRAFEFFVLSSKLKFLDCVAFGVRYKIKLLEIPSSTVRNEECIIRSTCLPSQSCSASPRS